MMAGPDLGLGVVRAVSFFALVVTRGPRCLDGTGLLKVTVLGGSATRGTLDDVWEMEHEEAYRTARICRNGHIRSEAIEEDPEPEPRCQDCGAETLTTCKCGTPIRGYLYVSNVVGAREYRRPAYCHACGDPYPWTATAKRKYVELLNELDVLTPEERRQLEADADDLIAETAGTAVAVVRFKKALARVSARAKEMAPLMLQAAWQMACETAWTKIKTGG